MKKMLVSLAMFITSMVNLQFNVFAEDGLINLNALNFEKIVASIYSFLFPIGILVGVGSIIIAGYKFLTSEGNPQMVADAKDSLYSAVVGTLFIILALALLRIIIKTTFNIEI